MRVAPFSPPVAQDVHGVPENNVEGGDLLLAYQGDSQPTCHEVFLQGGVSSVEGAPLVQEAFPVEYCVVVPAASSCTVFVMSVLYHALAMVRDGTGSIDDVQVRYCHLSPGDSNHHDHCWAFFPQSLPFLSAWVYRCCETS